MAEEQKDIFENLVNEKLIKYEERIQKLLHNHQVQNTELGQLRQILNKLQTEYEEI